MKLLLVYIGFTCLSLMCSVMKNQFSGLLLLLGPADGLGFVFRYNCSFTALNPWSNSLIHILIWLVGFCVLFMGNDHLRYITFFAFYVGALAYGIYSATLLSI